MRCKTVCTKENECSLGFGETLRGKCEAEQNHTGDQSDSDGINMKYTSLTSSGYSSLTVYELTFVCSSSPSFDEITNRSLLWGTVFRSFIEPVTPDLHRKIEDIFTTNRQLNGKDFWKIIYEVYGGIEAKMTLAVPTDPATQGVQLNFGKWRTKKKEIVENRKKNNKSFLDLMSIRRTVPYIRDRQTEIDKTCTTSLTQTMEFAAGRTADEKS
ncbi:hypothetical protein DICVIV_01241 [Dictyocaulus viviparus]|uniref:Uncharacterized protein n=1 Tax=Dictyocaulus viviparus TaxID=29172 RepID=A0A0D8YD54_DICVI|nr:hypothetical protein DICVIV_01241 [Dictyocaulus viviparus]